MTVLITGCLGHIGSRFVRFLLKKKVSVIGIDNFLTNRYVSLRGVISNKNFQFIEADLSKITYKDFSNLLKDKDFNVIIHLAAITNASDSFKIKDELFFNNLNITKLITKFCKIKSKQLIFASSTSVYGTSKNIVYENDKNALNPQSPYAECKKKEEEIIINSNLKYFQILRLGTIFGISPGMRFHTAVNKFCYQSSLRKPITVWRTALEQYRPYLDIKDACNVFYYFILHKQNNGIYNILTNNYKVSELLNSIRKYDKNIKIEFVNNKIMNQLSYFVSNDKIKDLNFKFKGNLNKSIEETINWLKKEVF